jgi:hypothetical protein
MSSIAAKLKPTPNKMIAINTEWETKFYQEQKELRSAQVLTKDTSKQILNIIIASKVNKQERIFNTLTWKLLYIRAIEERHERSVHATSRCSDEILQRTTQLTKNRRVNPHAVVVFSLLSPIVIGVQLDSSTGDDIVFCYVATLLDDPPKRLKLKNTSCLTLQLLEGPY